MKKIVLIALVLAHGIVKSQTARITFTAPMVYPEGVAFDKSSQKYFVSSVKTGTVGTVDGSGAYAVFYEDSTLKSSYGMKVDEKSNKLWVCTGDPSASKYSTPATKRKLIRLVGIDLRTRKKTDDIDLSTVFSGDHFLNDVALDDQGNKYLTDSYSPVVYKVDKAGTASVLLQSEKFKGADVGLNGVVWHKAGFLLVVNGSEGTILKIDLKSGNKITSVKVPQFFSGADGLLWDHENLILVQNKGSNIIYQLTSTDNWSSAKVAASTLGTDRFHQPSTATIGGDGKIYVLNSKLNELTDPTAPPSKQFSLQVARFVEVK